MKDPYFNTKPLSFERWFATIWMVTENKATQCKYHDGKDGEEDDAE